VTYKQASIVPVWLLAVVGSVLVGIFSPEDDYFTWLSMVFAVVTISAFGIQLFVPSKEGLVSRLMVSIGGAVIILAVATGILALLSA
jgi:hypothetical protein